MIARFGRFELNSDRRQLLDDGSETHLTPKAFDLLEALIRNQPNAVSKAEIQDLLWPETFVTESNLHGLVAELREKMQDDARKPRFIRTVHRHGYAFCGEAELAGAEKGGARRAVARLEWDRLLLPLHRGRNSIGRDEEADVTINDSTVSREHAVITITDSEMRIEDLSSKNGTFLNRRRVYGSAGLPDGATVGFGSVEMIFRSRANRDETRTA